MYIHMHPHAAIMIFTATVSRLHGVFFPSILCVYVVLIHVYYAAGCCSVCKSVIYWIHSILSHMLQFYVFVCLVVRVIFLT